MTLPLELAIGLAVAETPPTSFAFDALGNSAFVLKSNTNKYFID